MKNIKAGTRSFSAKERIMSSACFDVQTRLQLLRLCVCKVPGRQEIEFRVLSACETCKMYLRGSVNSKYTTKKYIKDHLEGVYLFNIKVKA